MKAEIITTGTELLLGEILNTNAQYLAVKLNSIGIDVLYQSTVGDNPGSRMCCIATGDGACRYYYYQRRTWSYRAVILLKKWLCKSVIPTAILTLIHGGRIDAFFAKKRYDSTG